MKYKVLMADDEPLIRMALEEGLTNLGYQTRSAADPSEGLELAEQFLPHAVLLDDRMGSDVDLEHVAEFKRIHEDGMVILMTACGSVSRAVEAMKVGVSDYVQKPVEAERVDRIVRGGMERLSNRSGPGSAKLRPRKVLGCSPAIVRIREDIEVLAENDNVDVLIYGETGSCKEVVVNSIHSGSSRRNRPLVRINCSAIPENLLESELFGYEKGAFTGTLGEGYIGSVTVDLAKIPHMLLGGSTGSGKSVLLKLLLMQALHKGTEVYIADLKGGVDFPPAWHEQCRMYFEEDDLIELLTGLADEVERRKRLFKEAGCPNLDEYNKARGTHLKRFVLACDEVAEILDKSGADKTRKDKLASIESKLSIIARQGRAFGIHLILATQRLDANLIPGQIRTNLGCRICGRADSILSQIILDSTAAADQISKEARGRFLLHDGTVFQGYWFDERKIERSG